MLRGWRAMCIVWWEYHSNTTTIMTGAKICEVWLVNTPKLCAQFSKIIMVDRMSLWMQPSLQRSDAMCVCEESDIYSCCQVNTSVPTFSTSWIELGSEFCSPTSSIIWTYGLRFRINTFIELEILHGNIDGIHLLMPIHWWTFCLHLLFGQIGNHRCKEESDIHAFSKKNLRLTTWRTGQNTETSYTLGYKFQASL